jgi:hypothetical protein
LHACVIGGRLMREQRFLLRGALFLGDQAGVAFLLLTFLLGNQSENGANEELALVND